MKQLHSIIIELLVLLVLLACTESSDGLFRDEEHHQPMGSSGGTVLQSLFVRAPLNALPRTSKGDDDSSSSSSTTDSDSTKSSKSSDSSTDDSSSDSDSDSDDSNDSNR